MNKGCMWKLWIFFFIEILNQYITRKPPTWSPLPTPGWPPSPPARTPPAPPPPQGGSQSQSLHTTKARHIRTQNRVLINWLRTIKFDGAVLAPSYLGLEHQLLFFSIFMILYLYCSNCVINLYRTYCVLINSIIIIWMMFMRWDTITIGKKKLF